MASPDSRIDERWRTFDALRRAHFQKKIILGIDRAYARRWLLVGGAAPFLGRVTAWLLVALALVSLTGAALLVMASEYVLGSVLAVLAIITWRLLQHIAVSRARTAALDDEALFRKWFAERRLSILVKRSGDVVWNDLPDEPPAAD